MQQASHLSDADQRTATAQALVRIAELEAIVNKERARADRAEQKLSHELPEGYESVTAYIREINEENSLFTFQAAEARRLLRIILDMEHLCNCGPYFRDAEDMEAQIRAVLDDPPGAEARWREMYRKDAAALAPRVSSHEAETGTAPLEETQVEEAHDG